MSVKKKFTNKTWASLLEIANALNLPKSTLQYYEKKGLIAYTIKVGASMGYDKNETIKTVKKIRKMREKRISLKEVKEILCK